MATTTTLTAERPAAGPAKRLSTWTMTREAITVGFDAGDGFLGRCRGSDITRFRCGGRRFVTLSHPDYVDHVLHRARLRYVKSNEYEPVRATAGINLLTDEGDSWAAHRGALNPTFARRRLNELVDLMIDPIEDVTAALADRGDGVEFDMHETMVEATLRVVANALFSQDFGPLVGSMNDLATRGMRRARSWNGSAYGDSCRRACTTCWCGPPSRACHCRRHCGKDSRSRSSSTKQSTPLSPTGWRIRPTPPTY